VPVKSVRELIDLAKAKPGELNYATASTGSSSHLATELFKSMAGINVVRIPYKGTGPGIIDLIGGRVHFSFGTSSGVEQHIRSGRLRALAVTSAGPSVVFPGLPPVAATIPGYESGGGTAMLAPPRTPATIVQRLNREVVAALAKPQIRELLLKRGAEVVASSPAELTAMIKAEIGRIDKLIKDAGLPTER
jgi:tripartite-type tricarboxylate transporter receptor subunit TctC